MKLKWSNSMSLPSPPYRSSKMDAAQQYQRHLNTSLSPPPPSPDRDHGPAGYHNNSASQYSATNQQPSLPQTSLPQTSTPLADNLKAEEKQVPPKVTKPRKPKEPKDPSAVTPDGETKPKRQRKPKDPNAPPVKRKKKNDGSSVNASAPTPNLAPQPVAAHTAPGLPSFGFGPTAAPQQTSLQHAPTPTPLSAFVQLGKAAASAELANGTSNHGTVQPHNRSISQARAVFDPIRSASMENARLTGTSTPPSTSTYQSPNQPRQLSTITIEPPIHGMATAMLRQTPTPTPPTRPVTTEPKRQTPSKLAPGPSPTPTPTVSTKKVIQLDGPSTEKAPGKPVAKDKPKSRSASPKPVPRKKATPPMLPGNGLLSGADFGKKADSEPKQYAQVPNDCIVIEVPITGKTNNYVNFLKEVENKYGFDVAHPRIAEHRRRMAQMAAAGAAIESTTGTADEMSLDQSSAEDSDVEMGGAHGEESGTATDAKKKRASGKRGDKYNLEDDFIDDTELAWTEQALASKDGYFVWSGPLVQEGDTPSVERADGTTKRGRGRGRGGTTRGGGSGRGGKAETGEKKTRTNTVPRKPRMKKSEKEALDKEKLDREKAGAATSTATNGVPAMTNGTDLPSVTPAT